MEIVWLALKVLGIYLLIILLICVLGIGIFTIIANRYNWTEAKLKYSLQIYGLTFRAINKFVLLVIIICIVIKFLTN